MKYLLLYIFFSITNQVFAQSADFILLKKKNKTIARYYVGSNIEFTTVTGAYLNGEIKQIRNDTIFLRQYIIQQMPTRLGVYVLDTVGSYSYQYHYNQIKAIGKTNNKKFNLSGSAATLLSGGILLALGSGVVYLADRKKFSPNLMYAGIGFAGSLLRFQ